MPKSGGERSGFGVVCGAFGLLHERREDGFIGHDGAVDQRCVDPAQGGKLVGFVVRILCVTCYGVGDLAADPRVQLMQRARGRRCL